MPRGIAVEKFPSGHGIQMAEEYLIKGIVMTLGNEK
jgi:hypothetical protein